MNVDDRLRAADERLAILLARQGDATGLQRLMSLYDRRLLYFIRRILGEADGALDVLQSVWLTVHRRIADLHHDAAFRVWLYRIAHDTAVSELRKKLKRPVVLSELEPDHLPADARDEELACDNAEWVHRGLLALSPEHRQVLTLRFLESMSVEEIAAVTACSPGTVKSRLYYSKRALRHHIERMMHASP